MESSENFIESEDEVKKLQELVKKLEKQNEVLRSKQKVGDVTEKSVPVQNNNHPKESASDSLKDRSSGGGFDDVDVLDIDSLSLKDEEDSWLYSSPKPPTPQQTNTNLYKWVRQDFDHPSPEIESARRSLLSKLNEAARMNRSSSTPSLGTNTSPTKSVAPSALSRSTEETPKPYNRPHQKQSLLSMAGNRIDNGTFTRPKKSHDRQGPLAPDRERGEDEAYHSFDGTTDVEKLARQQEESLRQSMATYTSPKRVIHNKAMSVASDTDNSGSPVGSNRSSPAQYDAENNYVNRHRNSFGSDNGTPPDSPRTVQQHSTPYSDSALPRRGLPTNLSRLQYPQPASHSSDSSLEHQSVDSMDDLQAPDGPRTNSRLPGPGFRAASPAMAGLRPGLAGAARGPSPQRSGLPTPRRGIPRPASAAAARSALPTPRRSGIPSPRPTGPGGDESWRDGCF